MRIQVTYYYDGNECETDLPAKNAVCPECEGTGYTLTEGMRNHAYSAEEFADTFSEEGDADEYFRPGGRYDVKCPCCHGKNVVLAIDTASLTEDENAEYARYKQSKAEERAERYYEARELYYGA